MALITDPDSLNDGATDNGSTEVFIKTSDKTIKLNTTGNLSTDGVTLKALYSFLKEEWKNDPHSKNLPAFPFPMVPITDESFEIVDGWDFLNDTGRYLIRTAGWTVRNTSGNVTQKWAGVMGLGSIESNDQLYYWQGGATTPTNFQLTGQVNQAVKILDDPNGDGNYVDGFDRRTALTIFTREQGQTFAQAALSDIGVGTLDSIAYRFPISTGSDLKINTIDTAIKASGTGYPADVAPFSGMTITYYATPQVRALSGGNANFGIIIDANGQSLQEVYNFVQYALRQNADINADTPSVITGKIADLLCYYVGDTLYTRAASNPDGGGTGVFIDDFDTQDLNSVVFTDNTGASKQYAYVATLTLSFGANLIADAAAEYWVYYSTLPVVARTVADAAINASDGTLTSATAVFVANDVDAFVRIAGAGTAGAAHYARIVSRTSATEVEITPNAVTSVTGAALEIYGGDWGETGALIVDDNSNADMVGPVSAQASVTRTYNFDGNVQGNRVPPAVPDVTAIAIGLTTGQYVKNTGSIARSKSNSIALVAPLERTYAS